MKTKAISTFSSGLDKTFQKKLKILAILYKTKTTTNIKMRVRLFILFISLHLGLNAQIPMEGLQGYWPFNGSADEFLENENNGIINGAILTQDRCGNPACAYSFDGVNDFIECTADSLDITDEVSISLWIKKSELGIGADIAVSKFSVFDFDTGYNIQFDANGAPEIRGRDGNDFFSESDNNSVSLLDDEWHHVVGIVDKSTWKIYVDSELIGSFDNGHTMVDIGGSTNNLRFGRRSSNSMVLPPNFYKGEIDDIFIYNRAITLEEINILYELDCHVVKESEIEYIGCINDGFEIEVNNVVYSQANPVGVEVISLAPCIDSIIQVNLSFFDIIRDTISYSGCEGDGFEVLVGTTLYNEFFTQGEETIISQTGCDTIITIDLFFEDATLCLAEEIEVALPNIFTPGLTINNIFRIRAPDSVEIIDLKIFDRWGNLIYDNDNSEQEWDGTIDGNPAPSDVYIYTVTYIVPGQNPIRKSSDLTLLR